jgi:hypothetical protein
VQKIEIALSQQARSARRREGGDPEGQSQA